MSQIFCKLVDREDFAEILLINEKSRNVLSPEMMEEFEEVLAQVPIIKKWRFIILKAEGKSFCAGADLKWMKAQSAETHLNGFQDSNRLLTFFNAIFKIDIPIIAFIHGDIFGGGVGLVAMCDYVIVHEETKFCLSEVKLGLVPAVISHFVQQKIGISHFLAYSTTARVFSAEVALRLGLAHEIYHGQINNEVLITSFINVMLKNGPEAMLANKSLIKKLYYCSFDEESGSFARQMISRLRIGSEAQEGMSSVLEKRSPRWLKSI